jgi:hypothetical protein
MATMDEPAPDSRAPWLLFLALANFVALVGGAWFIGQRLNALEDTTARLSERPPRHVARAEEPEPSPAPAPAKKPAKGGDGKPDGKSPPTEGTLIERFDKVAADLYDYYADVTQHVYDMERTLKKLQSSVKAIELRMRRPGGVGPGGLAPADQAPTAEVLAQYAKDAEAAGVKATPGRVEVRGFLNISPNTSMPIEYFVTRWPELGHETLVHVVGPVDVTQPKATDALKGLVTAIYKGLVVAGFRQGQPSGWEPITGAKGAPPPSEAQPTMKWVPPTGDVVYMGVRWHERGATHVARATDWVVDPGAKSVLPQDAFRFTGSRRDEDYESGDEALTAEMSGQVASVYRTANSLFEIALESNLRDDYAYNFKRIPKPVTLVLAPEGEKESTATPTSPRIDLLRDRATATLTIHGGVREGARPERPLTEAPVLLLPREEGGPLEVPFRKADGGGWTVTHDGLRTAPEWQVKVRLEAGGAWWHSASVEPLFLDLIFSKTPIQPEGDGARPLEPVVITGDEPTGMGERPQGPK